MTVTVTRSASSARLGRAPWFRISGTIQEVLDELQKQDLGVANVVDWVDGGTNAVAIVCKTR